MSLRGAVVEDAAACADIVYAWLECTDWMPEAKPSLADLTNMIAKGIPEREFWIIGEPVGGYLSFKTDENLIAGLYTEHLGSGMGKALIDAAKGGRDDVQLWTHEANEDAHRFYHREGFVTMKRCAQGRGDGIAELRMEWRA